MLLITLGLGRLLIGLLTPSTYEEGALRSSKLPFDPQLYTFLLFLVPSYVLEMNARSSISSVLANKLILRNGHSTAVPFVPFPFVPLFG